MTSRGIEGTSTEVIGLQSYVSTPFDTKGEVDLERFRVHLEWIFDPAGPIPKGCFVACGAGEVWSLDLDEYARLVAMAVETVGGRTPVVAGVGYGTRLARVMARVAAENGSDGILVFPPYLSSGPPDGLFAHYAAIANSVDIAVLLYQRAGDPIDRETIVRLSEIPNVIGLKDGSGDLELIHSLQKDLGEGFLFGNGMPVAETWAPVFLEYGVRSYSPSGIDFIPELAWAFDESLAADDSPKVERILAEFFRPLKNLRGRQVGYGVSISKAALALRGVPIGSVRPPLIDILPVDRRDLHVLLEQGLALAAELKEKPTFPLLLRL